MTEVPTIDGRVMLSALPVAVYTTDLEGRITFFNEAAADLWGDRPEIGRSRWCGAWRLYWPDGRPLAHEDCPMAVTIREGRPVRGVEAVLERPDGTRVPFVPHPALLRDKDGRLTGAINLLFDVTERHETDIESKRLAAIVASSDDAIVSKTLDGRITSWNDGATRIFGYRQEEMIGQPITKIIPLELQHEEVEILAKLGRGERIEHYDTVRVAKDGRRVDISLTVSPLRDKAGKVVGASKVARDVTERKRSEELQRLLVEELNHRVKNTLATIQAMANQSLRTSASPAEFVMSFSGRVQALTRAHDLIVRGKMAGAELANLVREQVILGTSAGTRISFSGPAIMLDTQLAVHFALVLHELATNARKYGALSTGSGSLSIEWTLKAGPDRLLVLEWRERGVPNVRAPTTRGFGTTMIERSLNTSGGEASSRYGADGVTWTIKLPLPDVDEKARSGGSSEGLLNSSRRRRRGNRADLRGKRILLVEDEAFIAMEIEAQLLDAGCEVIGPAATIDEAMRLISEATFEAALLDANLGGRPVDGIAAALRQKSIPFAFATGYGRNGLPLSFEDAPVLSKPFGADKLLSTLGRILADHGDSPPILV